MIRLALIFVAGAASTLLAIAQDKPPMDPPELIALREEHLRSMQRAAMPVLSAYVHALEAQKLAFTRQGKLEEATAVDKEVTEITKQLQVATDFSSRTGAIMELTIVYATYGAPARRLVTDITKNLRKALGAGATAIRLDTTEGAAGVDPAPRTRKETTITYTINGQRKQKTFPEGKILNFKEDLQ